jgi:hypothetical protein
MVNYVIKEADGDRPAGNNVARCGRWEKSILGLSPIFAHQPSSFGKTLSDRDNMSINGRWKQVLNSGCTVLAKPVS